MGSPATSSRTIGPGKTNLFRTYAFFLQPTAAERRQTSGTRSIDPTWLINSPDPDAVALRSAQGNASIPWRLLYRVTYSERFLPPVSTGSIAMPQITPVMAVPVLDAASDFLFQPMTSDAPRPANNPANDIEANVVLASPTAVGPQRRDGPTTGPAPACRCSRTTCIPFDLLKTATTIVNWGDTNNAKLLGQLITSAARDEHGADVAERAAGIDARSRRWRTR